MQESNYTVKNKLIILYIIDELDLPITYMQFMKIILQNKFMNYFEFQQIVQELIDTDHIKASQQRGQSVLSLSDNGKNSLKLFSDRVPIAIKNYINSNLPALKTTVLNEQFVSANIKEIEDRVIVECNVSESDFTLFNLEFAVGTTQDARNIVNNWKNNSHEIYNEILQSLTKKRN